MHVSATARRYARSLARVAIQHRIEKTVGTELEGLWGFFRDVPTARLVLESPASTRQQCQELLEKIEAAVELTQQVKNFLRVLVEESRFPLFHEIVEGDRLEIDRYHGVVAVAVATAQPLDDAERETLRGTLQRSVTGGQDVRLDLTVNPELLGGAVIRIGSVVYDGSLVSQLNQLRQQLIAE
jgi:F-type H+-transporting ATPase subunit delta